MGFKDNRTFIEKLAQTGDVVKITGEVDWDLQAAAITGRSCEMSGPSCFFENLKDYPGGGRIFGSPLGTYRRLAIAMGMSPQSSTGSIFEEFERRIAAPVKPVVVPDGPCKENKMFGDAVNLYEFPVPTVHEGDGGRYIGTWHCVITKDFNSEWTNWGMHRLMVHDQRTICGYFTPASHFALMYNKYKQAGKPMPAAVAIGVDPLSTVTACSPYRIGENEADFAGALNGEPVELIRCETNDLLAPAHAEIILEGDILPDIQLPEGPFGEFPGYRTQGWAPQPVLVVKAITYRSNPIICMIPEGIGITDGKIGASLAGAISIKKRLQRHGVPVTDVYISPEMGALVAIISVKESSRRIIAEITSVVHGRRASVPKVIIVDDDIDVFNMNEVMHAFGTRLHPVRGVSANPDCEGWTLTPYLSPEERNQSKVATGVYDCTWPADWSRQSDIPVRMSFKASFPEQLQQKVLAEWKQYGF
ncbi:MAG: UbiD family decarboxylase [Desulfobacterales bacterium]|nr:UbiD family decarboxylase [Desulfobacterales bacterium]